MMEGRRCKYRRSRSSVEPGKVFSRPDWTLVGYREYCSAGSEAKEQGRYRVGVWFDVWCDYIRLGLRKWRGHRGKAPWGDSRNLSR